MRQQPSETIMLPKYGMIYMVVVMDKETLCVTVAKRVIRNFTPQ